MDAKMINYSYFEPSSAGLGWAGLGWAGLPGWLVGWLADWLAG